MNGPGGLVFGVAGLLVLIALLPRLATRLRLPYTVVLAGLGCTMGLGIGLSDVLLDQLPGPLVSDFIQQLRQLNFSADLLLWVFLPILLFDTSSKLDGRELLDDLGPILILAVLAVLMTTAAAGCLGGVEFSAHHLPIGSGDHCHHRPERRDGGVSRGRRTPPAYPARRR